ncbi:MAG TPA: L,D-transpeptidase [Thermoanaerobaculia bacterium]|nr:L,D-transpeptidase [Thermoanaerobaculia bacterium]
MKSYPLVLAAILVSSMAVPLAAQEAVEGLPDDAPRVGTVITVDVATNTLYLFEDGQPVVKSPVATGTGKVLVHGDDEWAFHTPRGHLKVLRKIVDPVWRKPDWAFIEAGERIPPADSPKRYVKGELGKYALDLGEGILIHGTEDADSIGKRASHGCIRLPADALDKVYHSVKVGTDVYIFESHPVQESTSDLHSDLEIGRRKRK